MNARGVPGTLGCFALTLDERRLVFITSYHVVFGANAREQQVVRVDAGDEPAARQPVGRARNGRHGVIAHAGVEVHVDCATVEVDPRTGVQVSKAAPQPVAAELAPGATVFKVGAATGRTSGVVVDTNHSSRAWVGTRAYNASAQILVRPTTPGETFSSDGDSGAVLRNSDGAVVGLLWGVDARGFGLVCPIAPVLWVLHVELVRLAAQETS